MNMLKMKNGYLLVPGYRILCIHLLINTTQDNTTMDNYLDEHHDLYSVESVT